MKFSQTARYQWRRVVALIVAMLSCSPVYAQSYFSNISVSGFGSLAVTHSGTSELSFRSNLAQKGQRAWSASSDSVIGLQLDGDLTESVRATLQMIGQNKVKNDLNSDVEWAYLTYQINNDWMMRLGRVALDMTLVGEVSHVGYAYDYVRPPTEFYGTVPIYSFDGADWSYFYQLGNGLLTTKLFFGKASRSYYYRDNTVGFGIDPFYGISLKYELNNVSYRLGYAHSTIKNFSYSGAASMRESLDPLTPSTPMADETSDYLTLNGDDLHYFTSSIAYQHEHWSWMGEMSYLDCQSKLFLPYFAAYAGGSYHFDTLSVYSFISDGHTTKSPYQVSTALGALTPVLQSIFNLADSNQTTFSVGTRWDLMNNLALKFQWDRSWVKQNESLLWVVKTSDNTNRRQTVDTFTLSLNFIF